MDGGDWVKAWSLEIYHERAEEPKTKVNYGGRYGPWRREVLAETRAFG